MSAYPVISLKPSYNSIVRGCPGLPETLPRLECQLQIRSSNGNKLEIDTIEVRLKTVETLHSSVSSAVPFESSILGSTASSDTTYSSSSSAGSNVNSPSSITNQGSSLLAKARRKRNNFEMTTVHYKKIINLKSTQKKNLIGLDIPLTIALPDNVKETNYNEKFGNCVTTLECNVNYSGSRVKEFAHLINIERYIFLPSTSLFPRVSRSFYSPDKRFKIKYSIENPCVTTDDILNVNLEVKPNLKEINNQQSNKNRLFNKKIKLKTITFQLKEILQVNDTTNVSSHHHAPHINNNIDSRENTLQSFNKDVNEVISINSIKSQHDIRIFTEDKFFKNFESTSQEPEFLFKLPTKINESAMDQSDVKTLLLQNKNINIPFQYHNSITTLGSFFSILHCLTIKFKISNGKDFEINQNITISKWSKSQLKYIEQLVNQERQTAKFAKQFYNNFGGITKKRLETHKTEKLIESAYTDNTDLESNYYLEYPILPPVLYYNTKETLTQFNIKYDLTKKIPQKIPVIE